MKSKRTEEVAYLSTAMATRVKTDADTEMPCTVPLSLHTRLPKGHPAHRKRQTAVSGLQELTSPSLGFVTLQILAV